jgi:hypothetical protein
MDASEIIDALRSRAKKFVSLDTPGDQDLADVATDIGAGFVPGVGTALSARDFERSRREGDKLGMALSSIGMVPVVGGATRAVGKALRGAEKAAPRMSAAEAAAAGYWHPIGLGKKLSKPYDEMTYTAQPVKNLPTRKQIGLEDLEGQYIVPAIGDRTAAGKLLTEVDGVKFQNPVMLEGGPDFMLTHGAQPGGSVWASGQSVVSKLRNRAVGAQQANPEAAVNLMYVPMGHNSLNFSTMPTDAALEMIRSGKITKKSQREFDDAVRSLRPEFAGLQSPEVVAQLRNNGALRHAFLDRMQLDDFQKAGFPELASIRKAIMEPSLGTVPNYHGGYSVGRIDTSQPIIKNARDPHSTYDTQLAGQLVGGLDVNIPHTELWKDFFKERRARGMPESGDRMAFERTAPAQLVTPQLIDELQPLIKALREGQ